MTQVAKPRIADAGCWAQVRRYTGSLWAQHTACGNRPRKGLHTCARHAHLEADAASLAALLKRTPA